MLFKNGNTIQSISLIVFIVLGMVIVSLLFISLQNQEISLQNQEIVLNEIHSIEKLDFEQMTEILPEAREHYNMSKNILEQLVKHMES